MTCAKDIFETKINARNSDGESQDVGSALIELSTQCLSPNAFESAPLCRQLQQHIKAYYQADDSVFKSYMGFLPEEESTHSAFSVSRFTVPFIADDEIRKMIRKLHTRIPTFSPTLWSLRNSPLALIQRYYVIDRNESRLNTYRVHLSNTEENLSAQQANIFIIALHGSGGCALEVLENTLSVARDLISTEGAGINSVEVLSFDYRGSVASPGYHENLDDLADQVVDQVGELHKQGISSNKIFLYGHSLGGLIGVNAAEKLQKQGENIYYFGDRVPNSVDDVMTAAIPQTAYIPSFFRRHLILSSYQYDASQSYIRLLPTHRGCLASKADMVVPFIASLVGVLQSKHAIDDGIVIEKINHTWPLSTLGINPFYQFCLQRIFAEKLFLPGLQAPSV